ncbi:conserved Plasmodium protein, unknown function [Plasmodium malariae]|uniref:Uncharacterized protein n=1 Tax=Plasmodium malariae TaxID=5858 RepID=A0A1C3L3N6_PLAMA|nr:conserved Plasmodium protein, unknown function [Plasmodium malariae]
MYPSDIPVDFYENPLSNKSSLNELESAYSIYTKNNASEEINILNSYIKNIAENATMSSSSVDIDNKLVNILSLSFLTFIDHVIYDSHIYALRNEFKKKRETNNNNITNNGSINSNESPKGESLNNVTIQDSIKIKNEIIASNIENNTINEKVFNNNKVETFPENTNIVHNNNIQVKNKEDGSFNELNNSEEEVRNKGTQIIYDPDVINLCLNNIYNQEMVNRIMLKKKENDTNYNKNDKKIDEVKPKGNGAFSNDANSITTNKNVFSDNKDINDVCNHADNATRGKEKISKPEDIYINEKTDNIKEKCINLNINKDVLQTNINYELHQRKIMINQINEKIKKKSNNNRQNFVNAKKYSMDDIFDI